MNMARRGVKLNTICPVCHIFDGDIGHLLFFKCEEMRKCWLLLDLQELRISLLAQDSIHDMLVKILGYQEATKQKIILLLRCRWSACNKVNAGERIRGVWDGLPRAAKQLHQPNTFLSLNPCVKLVEWLSYGSACQEVADNYNFAPAHMKIGRS